MKIAILSALVFALAAPTLTPASAQDMSGRGGAEMRMRGDRDRDSDRDRGGRMQMRDRDRGGERMGARRHRDWDRCRTVIVRSHRHGMDVVRRIRRCG